MSHSSNLSRREFFKVSSIAGSSLALSGSFLSSALADGHTHDEQTSKQLGVFVTFKDDGMVEIVCHRAEMGQGIMTSVPQMIAEEMNADWNKVSVRLGEANPAYGNQSTGGSASIRQHHDHIRRMGAVARDMLEQAAADIWEVEKSKVTTKNHHVVNLESGSSIGFGDLAPHAAKLPVPDASKLTLKSPDEYQIVGKDVKLQGLEEIVTGKAQYAQDIRLENMLIASIERPPVVGGKVKSFNADKARKLSGVVDVVQLKDRAYPVSTNPLSGVAVLAENTWAAIEGRKLLEIEWESGANASHSSDEYIPFLKAAAQKKDKVIRQEGDVYKTPFDEGRSHEAIYSVPYHHHMSMETPAATAVVEGDTCTVWAGSQTPQWGKSMVLAELGLDPKTDWGKVEFNNTLMGGAFGRKGKNDFALEAVELAKHSGRPVKVVWSREDDVKHGFYHAVAANYFKAELKAGGRGANKWLQRLASPPIDWTFNHEAKHQGATGLSLGFGDVPFDIENMSFENPGVDTHVRIGWFRAVGNINNQFGLGCFVDELAAKAKIPTRQMWMNLLGEDRVFDPQKEGFTDYTKYSDGKSGPNIDIARYKQVLNMVVKESGAETDTADNEGWGISTSYSFGSYVAAATKVRVVDSKVEVLEMHTCIDCGLAITPDRVRSQMEGAMIMGLSIALQSEITTKDGAVVQNNFHDYPVSRMNQVPDLYVHLIESKEAPGGVGEPGLPPIIPSIANAVYHASGTRIRDLPIGKTMRV